MTAASVDYQLERHAQDERFAAWTDGKLDASSTHEPEFAPEPVEPTELVTAEGAFYLGGRELRELADAGCVHAAAEIARRRAKRAAARAARAAND